MKTYNCTLRLGGNMLQTLPKVGITAFEMRLLRSIHGDDSVTEPQESDEIDRDEDAEYRMLAARYGRGRVEQLFRVSLEDFDQWLDDKLASEGRTSAPFDALGIPMKPLEGAEESVRDGRPVTARVQDEGGFD